MPGLSLLLNFGKNSKEKFLKLLEKSIYFEDYENKLLYENDFYIAFFTGYKYYPFNLYKKDKFSFFIEGNVYNKDEKDLEKSIFDIYDHFLKNLNYKEKIKNFILGTDGEYIIGIFDKENFLIFNDALGRLSLYYFQDEKNFLISRDIGIINNFISKKEIDENSFSEYLLFMYPLSNRTLIKNIYKAFPGTIFEYKNKKLKIQKIIEWNFEEKDDKEYKILLNNLYESFIDGIKNRTKKFKNFKIMLGLSGGFDSRAVFLGLKKINSDFYPVTFIDPDKKHFKDYIISKKIAEIEKKELKIFEIKEFNIDSIKKLIEIKGGLNYAEMGFMIDFLKEAKKIFGEKMVYFTGDGGDKLLPYLIPERKLKNYDELFKFIIIKNKIFDIKEVEKLTSLSSKKIKENILNIISSYPEKNLNYKYLHFLFYERCFKYLFEGEDRNRYLIFSISPFYSIDFFKNSIRIPDKYKKYYKLYKDFFKILNGEIIKIEKSSLGFDIFSKKIFLREFLKYNVSKYFTLLGIFQRNKKVYLPPFNLNKLFYDLIDKKNLNKIILNKEKFFTLLTLLLFSEN